MNIDISIIKGNIDAPRNNKCSAKIPPIDGPINAPAEYMDVNSPEISAYVSMLSGNSPVEIAETKNIILINIEFHN